MKTIDILIYDGCVASNITGPIDLFNIANAYWQYISTEEQQNLFQWRLISQGQRSVVSSSGIRLEADLLLNEAIHADVIIVPGLQYQSLKHLEQTFAGFGAVHQWLKAQQQAGVKIAANCSGTFLLAASGLLDNHRATTAWWLAEPLRQQYPTVELCLDQIVVEDRGIFTAGATTAYQNLCLELLRVLGGHELMLACARIMLVDINRQSQIPYSSIQMVRQHHDSMVTAAEEWIEKGLSQSISLNQLADKFSVSRRTFIRRFKAATGKTPSAYIQALRLEAAKRLLESSHMTIDRIVERVGYIDSSSFRRLFHREVGLSPRAYRERFSIRHDNPEDYDQMESKP
ncbi:GlxA family transcriptional regulator [Motiliproteus sp. MSK22-1]|uniref:GlxA family transcriptional regulator n=1 Tax=Motiliproteus sp. MSK22-1 TaxID=1897630 RepID=UPI0009768517|nr:helix-turn-helix domain-containing protein [Motiliproteus sp. MSK22-1]OMH39501.1 hypothetical protein BGP75_02610 [Motiliproteus sp. MSK22-1]